MSYTNLIIDNGRGVILNTQGNARLESTNEKEKLLRQFAEKIQGEYLELLRADPLLPKELLPDYWNGYKARVLIKSLSQLANQE